MIPHDIIQTEHSITLFSLAFCSVSSNFSTTDNLLTGSAPAEDCVVLSTTDQRKYYWQIFNDLIMVTRSLVIKCSDNNFQEVEFPLGLPFKQLIDKTRHQLCWLRLGLNRLAIESRLALKDQIRFKSPVFLRKEGGSTREPRGKPFIQSNTRTNHHTPLTHDSCPGIKLVHIGSRGVGRPCLTVKCLLRIITCFTKVQLTMKDPNLGPFSQLLLAEEGVRFYQFLRWNYTLNNLLKHFYC